MTMMGNIITFRPRLGQSALRRPRLLVRAARAGLSGWNRKRDLRRLLKTDTLPATGAALPRLRAEEEHLDNARRAGKADYDMHRHIMLLIAIMSETAAAAPGPVSPSLPPRLTSL